MRSTWSSRHNLCRDRHAGVTEEVAALALFTKCREVASRKRKPLPDLILQRFYDDMRTSDPMEFTILVC